MPLFRLNANAAIGWLLLAGGALAFAGLAVSNLPQAAALGLAPLMHWSAGLGVLLGALAACMAWLARGRSSSSGYEPALRQINKLVCLAYLLVHLYAFTRLAALWTVCCVGLAAFGLLLNTLPVSARHGRA